MALLGLIVMFFGVRPLVRRVIGPDQRHGRGRGRRDGAGRRRHRDGRRRRRRGRRRRGALPGSGVNVTGRGGTGSITSTGGPNVSLVGGDAHVNISNRTSAMIDIAQVQGQVHAESVQEGRRAGRTKSERNRRHHPHLAARKRSLRDR